AALVTAVRSSSAFSREHEYQTWDTLRLTLLTPRAIMRGKSHGIRSAMYSYLWAQGVPAAALACADGLLALLWVGSWLAAAWLAVEAADALGLAASVRHTSSWRSLAEALPEVCIYIIVSMFIPGSCL